MIKKFKDLKKGDHIYCVGINYKTYEPFLCEYELIDDMVWTGPERVVWTCHIIPINYNPNKFNYWCNNWDGNPTEFHPGWKWNNDGRNCGTTTSLEYAKEYYIECAKLASNQLDKKIKKLEKKINDMLKLKAYHDEQIENFDFDRQWKS